MSRTAIALLCLFLAVSCLAQENSSPQAPVAPALADDQPPKPSRLRIGVALEGGGALGFAHIGVLRWFEEHRIPIDYIAGTSMGGLVGGLYATGKSPQQLEQFVREQDWDEIIAGQTPYEDLSFRRKEDQRAFQNSIVLGLRHRKLSVGSGLNTGHDVSMMIDRETLPYTNLESFDQLPIPFRCVATDLVSAKEKVFEDGSLQTALRATMSIPGVFSPVREGEKVYVDGGLLGNLPTEVVRKMGAQIVIAVHLEEESADPKKIQSVFDVLGRSIDVVIRDNEIRSMAGADLIVNVNLRAYSSLDYDKAEAMMEMGGQAAEEKKLVLEPYAMDEASWSQYLQARKARERHAVPVPQFVKVEGTNPEAALHLEKFLQPLAGKPIDNSQLNQYLTRLTGIGKFDSADYRLASLDGQDGLVITVHEKNYAPPILQLAFGVDGSESDDVTYTLLTRLTLMDVAGYRSEWRTDIQFGNTYGVASELYRPFTATGRWFFAPHGDATSTAFKVFHKNDPQADYRLYRANIGADVGYGFNRFTEVRAGYEVGYLDARLRLGTPEFASISGQVRDTRLHFLTAHTDDPIAPRDGYSFETTFRWFDTNPGATGSFPLLQGQLMLFKTVSRPASIFVDAEGGTTFGSRRIGVPQFFLGGPARLSAYGTNELFGNQYYYFRVGYLHDLLRLPPFVGKKVYAIGAYEFGKMYGVPSASKFPNDVAAGILAETAIGPLLIGGSVGDTGHRKWFFQVGHVF
ncbi:MAG: patatin-like phospholipase family protein [Terriglobales bacterium]